MGFGKCSCGFIGFNWICVRFTSFFGVNEKSKDNESIVWDEFVGGSWCNVDLGSKGSWIIHDNLSFDCLNSVRVTGSSRDLIPFLLFFNCFLGRGAGWLFLLLCTNACSSFSV